MFQQWMAQRRKIGAVALLAAAATTGGCFGRFPMTKAVYNFNRNLGNEFESKSNERGLVKSIVMWVFIIIPVYGVAMLGDVLVLNLIEFWTGDQIEVDTTRHQSKDGAEWAWSKGESENQLDLKVTKDGQTVMERRFVRQSPTEMTVMDMQGHTLGTMLRNDKNIELFDTEGRAQGTLDLAGLQAQGS